MTGEVLLRDLHCHTLLKSNQSWDFLCLGVYRDKSENTWAGTPRGILGLSLVSDPLLWSWLSGNFAVCAACHRKKLKVLEGYEKCCKTVEYFKIKEGWPKNQRSVAFACPSILVAYCKVCS